VFSYAQSIETVLEDEEQFADQLKEYYAFGDALRLVLTSRRWSMWLLLLYNIYSLMWLLLLYNMYSFLWLLLLYNMYSLMWLLLLYNIYSLMWLLLTYDITMTRSNTDRHFF